MVALSDLPAEIYEALVGKGRLTISSSFKHSGRTVSDCFRINFEFVKEELEE